MRTLRAIVRDYEWIHIVIGLAGNLAFVVGSVFFLSASTQTAGVWLFIFGSAFMFVGSAGDALVRYERRRENRTASG